MTLFWSQDTKDAKRGDEKDADDESIDEEQKVSVEPTLRSRIELDTGEEETRYRKSWWQIWLPRDPPPRPRASLDDAPVIPFVGASIFSKLTYAWITELMVLGYQRTLQAGDLWKMDPSREASFLSEKLDAAWARRCKIADEYNKRLANGEIKPSAIKRVGWTFKALRAGRNYSKKRADLESHWREVDGLKEASLAWSLNDTLGRVFWLGGLFKVFGDTSQLMGPLLVKAIINFAKERAAAREAGQPLPSIGRGIGLAIGIFCVTVMASVCQHQFFWRSMTTGVLARAALIGSIYKRGVNLTTKARTNFPNSALVNYISADVSRIDACAQWFHAVWTAPIQVTICLAILLVQLGPSALAGFSLFALIIPFQERAMSYQFKVGRKSLLWTDKRAKVLLEVLGGMRIVKYFSYETPFLQRIFNIRKNELKGVRKIQFARSANIAFAFSVPVLAATLAFLTYTLTAHDFNVAVIFASLSLFQLLRQPLMFLPRALSATSDAQNAIARLLPVFYADLVVSHAQEIDMAQDAALKVENATFTWEESVNEKDGKGDKKFKGAQAQEANNNGEPFCVRDVNMTVARGSVVAIVGPVGSGKSSLLQGLVGEMRKVSGRVVFGGSVGYCQQSAWIQNASLRENVTFGQPFDEAKYWRAIENASLVPDLQVLPDGDLTEIGEKGINLSGGQKQRVNIARALYFDADVVILDDPLSAVDAHVGKALFHDAILGAFKGSGKTVILVTHALHFLSECDYIYTMASDGRIAEHGTYEQLISSGADFARLDKAFGGTKTKAHEGEPTVEDIESEASEAPAAPAALDQAKSKSAKAIRAGAGTGKIEGRLIVKEKRTTGSVSWKVYWHYIVAGKGSITAPLIVIFMVLMQTSQVMNSYTLVWWQSNAFDRPNSFYQILYACLGVSQALFTLFMGLAMDEMSYYVSSNLHQEAVRNIFYAPMSFFDTTPLGRILSVFGKDIDTIDSQLTISMRMFVLTLANVLGAVIIITILEHYFLIAAVFIAIGYNYFAGFYRASAREMKRLDGMLRSLLYAHFAESLSGLPTIRAYGEVDRFIRDDHYYVDLEDRALFLTVTNQRWLAIRVDFLGGIMSFVVAVFAVVGVSGISTAQVGLVLTYTTSLTQLCGMMTRQTAEVENYMNSVERVVEYSRGQHTTQEAPHEIKDKKPPPEWPPRGAIDVRDIKMSYRPGLPLVLKGLSMHVDGGEKIGVVGRTGAGKSSLMLALFRIVELSSGSISIDGVDISKIGLKDLRTRISIIPQDPLLFSGTIRSNLDPFNLYDDAHLWDALRRSFLVEAPPADGAVQNASSRNRYTLDTVIESEGTNLSVGERSLLSLARALVKDSRVVVMDEATASVDLETDSKIQETVKTQFHDRTLLCIAHRLRTIIGYDRVLVMDSGNIAEFDTPHNLYQMPNGIFRGMCDRSNISLDDITKSTPFDVD